MKKYKIKFNDGSVAVLRTEIKPIISSSPPSSEKYLTFSEDGVFKLIDIQAYWNATDE